MTEKRFIVIDDGFVKYIEDTTLIEDKHEGHINDAYELCRELNRLCEENQQLKKENHQLKQLIQAIISKEFEISSEDNDYDALTEFFKNEVSISQIEVDIDVEKEEREY